MKKPKKISLPLLILSMVFAQACNPDLVFQDNQAIPSEGWHYQDKITFSVEMDDTLSLHNLYLDVRNTTDYEYRNFFVFMDIEFPDNRVLRDTIECILAERSGEWTGKGFGRIKSNRFLFRTDVWFPKKGTYTFTIEQGMREEVLHGIKDIGIHIERK